MKVQAIKEQYDWEDLELYEPETPEEEQQIGKAVKELNVAIKKAAKIMKPVIKKWSEFGSMDSAALEEIFDAVREEAGG